MRIELLYWDGCPSHPKALAELREAIDDLGLEEEVRVRRIADEREAQRERFVGSPTILIDGRDLQPPGSEPYGLTCRVYRRRDGRYSPTPDPADVRAALCAACAQERQGGEGSHGDPSHIHGDPSHIDAHDKAEPGPLASTALGGSR